MIKTRVARQVPGDNLYFGHSTLTDLLGRETLTGLMAMAAMGRQPSEGERVVLDAIAVASTSADPRIWPLKLTRLVASYGGTLAGFGAGQLAMEGKSIGPWTVGAAAEELASLRDLLGEHFDDADAVQAAVRQRVERRPRMAGYGVPFRERDERMEALRKQVSDLGRDRLPFWTLQEALSVGMKEKWGAAPNMAIGGSAVLLDLGCTPRQAAALAAFLNQNVFAANAFEAAQQRSPLMQRLPDACVDYVGPAPRTTPRAAAVNKP